MSSERILIVDDDRDSVRLIARVLERQGYSVSVALNGLMALDRVKTDHPHLILLDVMMPDMTGYEVARRVRAEPDSANTPIILFTAKGMVADKVAGFEAGADDYLTKPTHPAELSARIKSVLERAAGRALPASKPVTGRLSRAPIVAFVGARGGSGVTTLVLNVAFAMAALAKGKPDFKPVLAEIRPGPGAMGLLINVPLTEGLATAVSKDPPDVAPKALEKHLFPHPNGVRLLLAPIQPTPYDNRLTPELGEKLAKGLAALGSLVLLDLGEGLDDYNRRALPLAAQIVIVAEPERVALWRGAQMVEEIKKLGIAPAKVGAVLVNRASFDAPLTFQKARDQVGASVLAVIAAAPDLAREAAETATPIVMLQPNSLPAEQFSKLAEDLLLKTGVMPPGALAGRAVP